MLRFTCFLCTLMVFCNAMASNMPEEEIEKMKKFHEECKEQTGVDSDEVKKAMKEGTPTDAIKEHTLCFVQKTGMIGDDNKIDMDLAKSHFESLFPELADDIMANCISDEEVTKDSVYNMAKCVVGKIGH
ncbi:B1 protein-like isoform X2 [Diabrotica undecimpunctata]|uniref:B1 protein-like isoform X2 n=1 Tax=Diabrotica undecimpunctata TaxID=50387 RepID=UPI003B640D15